MKPENSFRAAAVAVTVATGIGMSAVVLPATAGATMAVSCTSTSYSCLSGSGYGANTGTWADKYYYGGMHNCTRYVAFRLQRSGLGDPGRSWGNATEWWSRAPGVKNGTPAVGAIAYWAANKGGVSSSGHVAWVESFGADGSVTVTEDNAPLGTKPPPYNTGRRVTYSGANGPSGYIHITDKPSVGEGSFVRVTGTSEVFRIAGGAPIYVTDFAPFGGTPPISEISRATFDGLRAVPADGSFIRGVRRQEVYRIVGGAPMYVTTGAFPGGFPGLVDIDDWAIDRAGDARAHLRSRPANGVIVRGFRRGEMYVVAGGAPVYITPNALGQLQKQGPTVDVDDWVIDNTSDARAHLSARPAEGTFLLATDGRVFRITGGKAVYVPSWAPYGGPQTTVTVDGAALDNAGKPGVWSHIIR